MALIAPAPLSETMAARFNLTKGVSMEQFSTVQLLIIRNAMHLYPLPPDISEWDAAIERANQDAIADRCTTILEGRGDDAEINHGGATMTMYAIIVTGDQSETPVEVVGPFADIVEAHKEAERVAESWLHDTREGEDDPDRFSLENPYPSLWTIDNDVDDCSIIIVTVCEMESPKNLSAHRVDSR